jgi:hypothetical protein
MGMVLQYTTENEIAEYILEKLHPKKLVNNIKEAKEEIKQCYELANKWLSMPENSDGGR